MGRLPEAGGARRLRHPVRTPRRWLDACRITRGRRSLEAGGFRTGRFAPSTFRSGPTRAHCCSTEETFHRARSSAVRSTPCPSPMIRIRCISAGRITAPSSGVYSRVFIALLTRTWLESARYLRISSPPSVRRDGCGKAPRRPGTLTFWLRLSKCRIRHNGALPAAGGATERPCSSPARSQPSPA